MHFNFVVSFADPEFPIVTKTATLQVRTFVNQETKQVESEYLLLKSRHPEALVRFFQTSKFEGEILPLQYNRSAKAKVRKDSLLKALSTKAFNTADMTVDTQQIVTNYDHEPVDWAKLGVRDPYTSQFASSNTDDSDDVEDEDDDSDND